MTEDTTRRRVHERFPCDFEVTLTCLGVQRTVQASNISLGGIFLISNESLDDIPFGSQVRIRFALPAHKKPTEIGATVRWKIEGGIGVQFESLGALDTWVLNEFFKSARANA